MRRFFVVGAGIGLAAATACGGDGGGGSITITTVPPAPTVDAGADAGTSTPTPPEVYSVGGTVSGLTGTGLVLEGIGAETLAVSADGPFTFTTKLASGAAYGVFVQTQPQGETCIVTNGVGVMAAANITDVSVTCAAPPQELFVSDYTGAAIPVFDAADNGNIQPKRTIEGVLTQLSHPRGIFVSESELFVADETGLVLVFDRAAGANVAPLRTLSGSNTGLHLPSGVFVDQGELFVADGTGVLKVWNATDSGNVAPKRTLGGPTNGLSMLEAPLVDDGELYVSSFGGTVSVFPRDATDDAPATRTLSGLTPSGPVGIVINGDELFIGNAQARIDVVDKSSGAFLRSISGTATGLRSVDQCTIVTGTVLCATYDAGRVLGFPLAATGDTAPSRDLFGNLTSLLGPRGVFLAP